MFGPERNFKLAATTDFNLVTELASKGTAADAGVRLFDRIIKVDGEACAVAPVVHFPQKDQLKELLEVHVCAFSQRLHHESKEGSTLKLESRAEAISAESYVLV